jgi:hypothetical protein
MMALVDHRFVYRRLKKLLGVVDASQSIYVADIEKSGEDNRVRFTFASPSCSRHVVVFTVLTARFDRAVSKDDFLDSVDVTWLASFTSRNHAQRA